MSNIFNTQVPQASRAKLLFVNASQSHADIAAIAKSTDALILRMGGMNGVVSSTVGPAITEESGFRVRVGQAAQAGIPVLAEFEVNALYYLDIK